MASQLRRSSEWHSIYINPDLTQKEREAGKKLREELAQRRRAGEQNIYIKRGRIVCETAQAVQGSAQAPSTTSQPTSNSSDAATAPAPTDGGTGTSVSQTRGPVSPENGMGAGQPLDNHQS